MLLQASLPGTIVPNLESQLRRSAWRLDLRVFVGRLYPDRRATMRRVSRSGMGSASILSNPAVVSQLLYSCSE